MGRSVYTPCEAVAVVFLHPNIETAGPIEDTHVDEREDAAFFDFDEFLADLVNVLIERFPSLESRRLQFDREALMVAENDHGLVVVSEYMGLVSVSLVPQVGDDHCDNLHRAWCEQVNLSFLSHLRRRFPDCVLTRVGTASNGETFYRKVGA